MDGDRLLRDLRSRLRARAIARAVLGSAVLAVPLLAGRALVVVLLPVDSVLLVVFVWRIVRAPLFLDRPDLIERVELLSSLGHPHLRVVLTGRGRVTVPVRAEDGEAIKAALDRRRAMTPARAIRT